jgi:hypothetical protein
MGPFGCTGQDSAAKTGVRPCFAYNTIERLFEPSPGVIFAPDAGEVTRAANSRPEDLFGYSSLQYSSPEHSNPEYSSPGYSSLEHFGQPVEIPIPARFRITIDKNSNVTVINQDGRSAAPLAAERGRLLNKTDPAAALNQLSLNLRQITSSAAGGVKALRAINSQTETAILTGTQCTEYLAEEVARKST